MNVKELIDAGPNCDTVEVVVRENGYGKWIQGYRIGKNVGVFPSEYNAEIRELYGFGHKYISLKNGQVKDVIKGYGLMMKVICKSVNKLPENVANLTVCNYQPRHVPCYHREALTHNEFMLEINVYPEGWEELSDDYSKNKKVDEQLPGQMDIFDILQGEEDG